MPSIYGAAHGARQWDEHGGDRTERDCTFRLDDKARPNMNADKIIANDAHRAALRLSATAFTQWGIASPADPVGDLAAVRELRV